MPTLGKVSSAVHGITASLGVEKICRACNNNHSITAHVDIEYGDFHIVIDRELLNHADVLAAFQQMGGVTWPNASVADPPRMAEGVALWRDDSRGQQRPPQRRHQPQPAPTLIPVKSRD